MAGETTNTGREPPDGYCWLHMEPDCLLCAKDARIAALEQERDLLRKQVAELVENETASEQRIGELEAALAEYGDCTNQQEQDGNWYVEGYVSNDAALAAFAAEMAAALHDAGAPEA